MIEKIKEFVKLADEIRKIHDHEGALWETKYNLIFSDDLSGRIASLGISLTDYWDPDTSYEEDVKAYVQAVMVKADELRGLVNDES
jgi:hypothetical protein